MTDIIHQDIELDGADEGDWEGLTSKERVVPIPIDRTLADWKRLSDDGDILDTDWQREDVVWDDKRASRLIESFLIDLPVPAIYLARNDNQEFEVIDGLQRLTSVFRFLEGKLKLKGLEARADLNGCYFNNLEKGLRKKLLNSVLRTIELYQPSDGNLKYVMFQRLNTGGVALNDMEIRNCVYQGELNNLIKELAQNQDFKDSVNQTNLGRRMRDRRLVLGFLAFYERTYTKATKGLKAFFNEFCEIYRNPTPEKLEEFRNKFNFAMKATRTIFGESVFRSTPKSRSVNAPIFQVICVSFTNYDQEALIHAAADIRAAYHDLIKNDSHWVNCVSTSTGTWDRISYTFETWNERLKQVMENVEPQLEHRHYNAIRSKGETPPPTDQKRPRTKPTVMTFNGHRDDTVKKWSQCLTKLCDALFELHPGRFSEVLELKFQGKKVLRASKNRGDLINEVDPKTHTRVHFIPQAGIYIYKDLSQKDVKWAMKCLATHFGHSEPEIEERSV